MKRMRFFEAARGPCRALLWLCLAALVLTPWSVWADASEESYLQQENVRGYLLDISEEHGLDHNQLVQLFATVYRQQGILDAIARPAEKRLEWGDYRAIFLGEERVAAGRAFRREHDEWLQKAEQEFGVPASIITAIIGVETFYGRLTGKHRIVDALATLAFDYPPRSKFFQAELTEYLRLATAESWDMGERRGSYAGAMGFPQFISSSYRAYAVDFDGDGHRDLFGSIPDAIGSVGNYLARHGWRAGMPVAVHWRVPASGRSSARAAVRESLKPVVTPEQLASLGYDGPMPGSGALAALEGDAGLSSIMTMRIGDQEEFWVGYRNFYVITRYNHSRLYALAVVQLADLIDESTLPEWQGRAVN